MKRVAVARWVMTLALLSLALTGCERFDLGPAAITWQGDRLLLTSCVDMSVTDAYGEYSGPDGQVVFLDASGSAELATRKPVEIEQLLAGMSGVAKEVPREEIASLLVRFTGPDDEYVAGFHGAMVSEIEADEWLHPDGRITREPCDGVDW